MASIRAQRGDRAAILQKMLEVAEAESIKESKTKIYIDNMTTLTHRSIVKLGDESFEHLKDYYDIRSIVFILENDIAANHRIQVEHEQIYSHVEDAKKIEEKSIHKFWKEGYKKLPQKSKERIIHII